MRIPLNPFWLFAAIAVVVLVAIVLISSSRQTRQAPPSKSGPGATTRSHALPTAVVALALAVILIPFGIAAAAIGGPEIGVLAYGVLLALALTGRTLWRQLRH